MKGEEVAAVEDQRSGRVRGTVRGTAPGVVRVMEEEVTTGMNIMEMPVEEAAAVAEGAVAVVVEEVLVATGPGTGRDTARAMVRVEGELKEGVAVEEEVKEEAAAEVVARLGRVAVRDMGVGVGPDMVVEVERAVAEEVAEEVEEEAEAGVAVEALRAVGPGMEVDPGQGTGTVVVEVGSHELVGGKQRYFECT